MKIGDLTSVSNEGSCFFSVIFFSLFSCQIFVSLFSVMNLTLCSWTEASLSLVDHTHRCPFTSYHNIVFNMPFNYIPHLSSDTNPYLLLFLFKHHYNLSTISWCDFICQTRGNIQITTFNFFRFGLPYSYLM